MTDISGMRTLYDELQAQVRNLKSLGLDANNYGPMLVPVLMSKLPEEMKLIISREFNSEEIWDIAKILEKFKAEIQAREKVCFVVNGNTEGTSSEPYSGASFVQHGNNFGDKSKFERRSYDKHKQSTKNNNPRDSIDVGSTFCRQSHAMEINLK